MPEVIEILPDLPDEPMSSAQVARALGKNVRTVQDLGKLGVLKSTLEPLTGTATRRMYDPESVRRYLKGGQSRPQKPAKEPAALSGAMGLRRIAPASKPPLETLAIVGNLVALNTKALENAQKDRDAFLKQLEGHSQIASKNLETVVGLILNAQRAEADANRERLKAEREDARERWEMERQERLERRKERLSVAAPPEKLKARKAHA